MKELSNGQKVKLTNGEQITVIKELGRGGQGIVYLVDLHGKQMALKWYINPPDESFYDNLQKNVRNGAPSDAFIWPLYLTTQMESYGYVMKLRPEGYYDFGDFLLAKKYARFKSFDAMMCAAMKIVNGFKALHRVGLSYQDLNDGNFFIRPEDGDVLICDNDNVMPQGEQSGILGKSRYMAPEVVLGQKRPDKYSDYFSLSLLLFMLFFSNHPFEGAKVVACPCMTEEYEKEFFGSEAVFIYDQENNSNRPVRGLHSNVIKRWPLFPTLLKNTFIEEFSKKKLTDYSERINELRWEKILNRVWDELVVCPHCGQESFLNLSDGNTNCMNCGKEIDSSNILQLDNKRKLVLTYQTRLYIDNDSTPDGKICYTSDKEMLLLQNLTESEWSVETPSGKIKIVGKNEFLPLKGGLKISFGNSFCGIIKGEIITNK